MSSTAIQPLSPVPLKDRLRGLRDALLDGLVERDAPVRLALLAALAGEHVLFLGPPGTAKSELARRLRHAFTGATYFERLLTRFTVPEELFGPLSIKALDEDRYHRQTAGYMPTATVVFLDEIFKANSAILNALLTLLNEREFDNGTVRERTPLVSVIAASNELAQEEGMEALYDRFLLRCYVGPVSDGGFGALLALESRPLPIEPAMRLSSEDLAEIRAGVARVVIGPDVLKMLGELRRFLYEQKIAVSDRRWRKIVNLLRTSAFTDGRDFVTLWDCWLLQHCTWNKPEERETIQRWYEERAGAAQAVDPAKFAKLTEAFEGRLKQDAAAEELVKNEKGEQLYALPDEQTTTSTSAAIPMKNAAGARLFLYPADYNYGRARTARNPMTEAEVREHGVNYAMPVSVAAYLADPANVLTEVKQLPKKIQPKAYEREYVDNRLSEVRKHRSALDGHIKGLADRLASLNREIDGHLWISPGFSTVARPRLEDSLRASKALLARWKAIEEGFAALPKTVSRIAMIEMD
jgi:MoxR-like ATPase